mgnify:CR=1 FL=1
MGCAGHRCRMSGQTCRRLQPGKESMALIELRDIWKIYDQGEMHVVALRDANLEVESGEFVALTGPSGSGKSTFMKILAGFYRPAEGELLLDGARQVAADVLVAGAFGHPRLQEYIFGGTTTSPFTT